MPTTPSTLALTDAELIGKVVGDQRRRGDKTPTRTLAKILIEYFVADEQTSKPTSSKEAPTPAAEAIADPAVGDFPNHQTADVCPQCGQSGGEYTPTLGECAFCSSSVKECPATVPGEEKD